MDQKFQNLKKMFSPANIEKNKAMVIKYGAYFIIVILVLGISLYIYNKMQLKNTNCTNLQNKYIGIKGNGIFTDSILSLVESKTTIFY